jgi:hypothetical protein
MGLSVSVWVITHRAMAWLLGQNDDQETKSGGHETRFPQENGFRSIVAYELLYCSNLPCHAQ